MVERILLYACKYAQVKNQAGLVDALHTGIDKNAEEVTGLTDRTQKLLKKG